MILFTGQKPVDATKIAGIGFFWNDTRPNVERDFRLTIDRIALAD
jgi:hypothetical protein